MTSGQVVLCIKLLTEDLLLYSETFDHELSIKKTISKEVAEDGDDYFVAIELKAICRRNGKVTLFSLSRN